MLLPLDGIEYYSGAPVLIVKEICYQSLETGLTRISLSGVLSHDMINTPPHTPTFLKVAEDDPGMNLSVTLGLGKGWFYHAMETFLTSKFLIYMYEFSL